jgi:hypothetical protein
MLEMLHAANKFCMRQCGSGLNIKEAQPTAKLAVNIIKSRPSLMSIHALLDELLTYPFASDELQKLINVIKRQRARWLGDMDSFRPARDFKLPPQSRLTKHITMLLGDDWWVEYADRVSALLAGRNDQIYPSLRHMAQEQALGTELVEKYLELLRRDNPKFPIAKTQSLDRQKIVDIMEGMGDRPVMLPLQDGQYWLFAALYPDTIHWYDSRPDSAYPTWDEGRMLKRPTGPKCGRPQDSALFMLLGLRLTANAHANLSQEEAELVIPKFHSRLLVEVMTGSLRPSPEDIDRALRQEEERFRQEEESLNREYEDESAYFNDATFGLGLSPESAIPGRPSILRSRTPMSSSQQFLSITPDPPHLSDDRRTILMTLCNAVASVRSLTTNESTDLAVLWYSLKDGGRVSEFHRRYNGILFADKLETCNGLDGRSLEMVLNIDRSSVQDVWDTQARFKLWRDLCKLYGEQGPAKYTLLCVIPEGQALDHQQISVIGARLADPADPLANQLRRAADLCRAIVESQLPSHTLFIESYRTRAHYPLSPEMYDAFLSLDSHPRVPIARMVPL